MSVSILLIWLKKTIFVDLSAGKDDVNLFFLQCGLFVHNFDSNGDDVFDPFRMRYCRFVLFLWFLEVLKEIVYIGHLLPFAHPLRTLMLDLSLNFPTKIRYYYVLCHFALSIPCVLGTFHLYQICLTRRFNRCFMRFCACQDDEEMSQFYKISLPHCYKMRRCLYWLSWINMSVKISTLTWVFVVIGTSKHAFDLLPFYQYVFLSVPSTIYLFVLFYLGSNCVSFLLLMLIFNGLMTHCRSQCLTRWGNSLFQRQAHRGPTVLKFYAQYISITQCLDQCNYILRNPIGYLWLFATMFAIFQFSIIYYAKLDMLSLVMFIHTNTNLLFCSTLLPCLLGGFLQMQVSKHRNYIQVPVC